MLYCNDLATWPDLAVWPELSIWPDLIQCNLLHTGKHSSRSLQNCCGTRRTPWFVVMQLTRELEAGKARVEDEMIATVHIVTGLEARLRQAKLEADLAQQQAQQADQRANQVLHCSSPSCLFTNCSSAFAVSSAALGGAGWISNGVNLAVGTRLSKSVAGPTSLLHMLHCCCTVAGSCLQVLTAERSACKNFRQIAAAAERRCCKERL